MAEVNKLDASVREKASQEVQNMHKQANQKKLSNLLTKAQQKRRGKLSKRVQTHHDKKVEKARARNQKRLEQERAALNGDSKTTAADSVEAASNVLTSRWKADALYAEAEEFVKKHMQWAWRVTKDAVVKFPRKKGMVQFKFVCPDTEHFDTGYINVAIIFIQGFVWVLPSTHMGGVAELIDGLPGRTVVLTAGSAIDTLPDSPFFSSTFAKDRRAITLRDIDMQRVPIMRPSFWAGDAIPSDVVLANIITKEDYDRAFSTVEEKIALSKKTQKHVLKLETDMARARAQARAEQEAALKAKKELKAAKQQ